MNARTHKRLPSSPAIPRLCAWLVALAAAWLFMPSAPAHGQQEVKVTASAPEQAYVGDAIPFRVAVDGAMDSSAPDVSALQREFEVVYHGPQTSTSSRMIVINGRTQQSTERRVVYTYSLAARRTGEVVIPAVAVRADGREYQTQPLRIRLLEPSRVAGLSASLSHSRAYIGQPLRLTVTWLLLSEPEDPVLTLGLPADSMDIYPLPAGATAAEPSPRVAEMDFVPFHGAPKRPIRGKVRAVNLDGEVRTEFSAEFLIVPRQAGQIAIGPVRCDFKAVVGQRPRSLLDSPFERNTITQRQYSLAPADTLEVLDLPSRGRPANFSGLVGSFLLDASCSPREASVGEPLTLNLMLRSPLPILNPPPVDLARSSPGTTDGAGGIAMLFRVPRDPVLPQSAGEMTLYTAAIRARSTRAQSVPPIEISYFDPDDGQYKIARSPPVSLNIRPAAAVGLGALEGLEDEAEGDGTGGGPPMALRPDLPERINGWFPPLSAAQGGPAVARVSADESEAWLFAAGVCGAALAFAGAISWRRAQRERDPARFRRCGAGRRARRALRAARGGEPERIAIAMRALIADLFNLDASSLTTGEAVGAVRRIDAVLASRFGGLLGACDQRLFGPGSGGGEASGMTDRLREAEELVSELCRAAAAHPGGASVSTGAATSAAREGSA
ncbi:MAG: BatD family protein [Phycisphaeraceae bacterium]|nr:BatD family protein [Phycisphaeraceae bacterium]